MSETQNSRNYRPEYDSPFVRKVRLELAIMKHIEGIDYTKSKYVADRVDMSSHKVGNAMPPLEANGDVARRGRTSGLTWEILL